MIKNLMIIESPNKMKSISKYLGDISMVIVPTYGHLRDLNNWGMGFDYETLEPKWIHNDNEIIFNGKKEKVIKLIKKLSKDVEKIYLSTDPDREGEAISWHVYSLLDDEEKQKCVRVVFNEISKNAISNALQNPRSINFNQVNSYLARRLLDRELGFKLSSYVKKKIGGISAGRVQSIALKFLQTREEEIKNFIPVSWWTTDVIINKDISLLLKKLNPKYKFEIYEDFKQCIAFSKKEDAEIFKKDCDSQFVLKEITKPIVEYIYSNYGLKTASLQTESISKFGLSAKQVESIAQKFYEGIDINGEETTLITYPRTDRTDFSSEFTQQVKEYVDSNFGKEYWNKPKFIKEDKNVQGAHEGIRPIDITITPDSIKKYLKPAEFNVYKLIWTTAIASYLKPAEEEVSKYIFTNNDSVWEAIKRKEIFDGFKVIHRIYFDLNIKNDKNLLNQKDVNNAFLINSFEITEHNKKPPSRYNEASLIKALENKGIGRPSTYVAIANTVLNRNYADKITRYLKPSELGLKVAENLNKNFEKIMSFDYTRLMEESLDKIEENNLEWKDFLHEVFDDFNEKLKTANINVPNKELDKTGDPCPDCQSDLIYCKSFKNKYSSTFIGCSAFPKCKYIKSIKKEHKLLGINCPECDKELAEKLNKRGQYFIACTGFPKCKYAKKSNKK